MLKAPSMARSGNFQNRASLRGDEFGERAGLAFISDFDRDRRGSRTFMLNLDGSETPKMIGAGMFRIVMVIPTPERFAFMATCSQSCRKAMDLAERAALSEGDVPFLDRFNLTTLKSERVFAVPETVRSSGRDPTRRWQKVRNAGESSRDT